ncbi:MepB family protein [Staphylococcus saccharolyticus]|uniref:MepB family protein n=1 Tax=Staphylococcus saccharolyticus TaxID=33028 RepID=A0A380GZC4_9STAP|nr:MepB family protein [Staphylococcus saccharolyticus]SUM67580.1 mepB family protein [Staphylococcus saccharolyticus]
MWKKNTGSINQPFNEEEFPEKLVVHIVDKERIGQFIFPKHALLAYGILSDGKNQGKMAFRVYPSWEKNLNNTARKTQKWQTQYFPALSYHYDKTKLEKL